MRVPLSAVSIRQTAPVSLSGPFTHLTSLYLMEVRGRRRALTGVSDPAKLSGSFSSVTLRHRWSPSPTGTGRWRKLIGHAARAACRREEETPMSELTPAPADLFLGDAAHIRGEAHPLRPLCSMMQSLGRAPLSLPRNAASAYAASAHGRRTQIVKLALDDGPGPSPSRTHFRTAQRLTLDRERRSLGV